MKLIDLTCTKCGATLKVNSKTEKCICSNCGEIVVNTKRVNLTNRIKYIVHERYYIRLAITALIALVYIISMILNMNKQNTTRQYEQNNVITYNTEELTYPQRITNCMNIALILKDEGVISLEEYSACMHNLSDIYTIISNEENESLCEQYVLEAENYIYNLYKNQ